MNLINSGSTQIFNAYVMKREVILKKFLIVVILCEAYECANALPFKKIYFHLYPRIIHFKMDLIICNFKASKNLSFLGESF